MDRARDRNTSPSRRPDKRSAALLTRNAALSVGRKRLRRIAAAGLPSTRAAAAEAAAAVRLSRCHLHRLFVERAAALIGEVGAAGRTREDELAELSWEP